jgi:hypothetical protein
MECEGPLVSASSCVPHARLARDEALTALVFAAPDNRRGRAEAHLTSAAPSSAEERWLARQGRQPGLSARDRVGSHACYHRADSQLRDSAGLPRPRAPASPFQPGLSHRVTLPEETGATIHQNGRSAKLTAGRVPDRSSRSVGHVFNVTLSVYPSAQLRKRDLRGCG